VLLVLGISGLGLLALPGWIRRAGRRLHPAEWALLSVVAVAGGAAVVEASALLYAAPVLAESSGVPALAQLCRRMLGSLAPGGQVAGWMAATVALTLLALGAVGCTRARRAARQVRVERGLGRHDALGAHELVVLPTAHLVAVSVPPVDARPQRGQIVVSDGLVDALAPDELDAVLRHEAAHLEHGHHRHLLVASVVEHAFAWFPPARRSTAALRTALERWADEEAAETIGDRGAVRQALLVVTASLVASPSLAAFSAAETIGERLDALDGDAPHPRLAPHLLLYCPGAALGAVAALAFVSWASGATAVLAMAGQCVS
jgi:Zn-dependent protease with chaperone function